MEKILFQPVGTLSQEDQQQLRLLFDARYVNQFIQGKSLPKDFIEKRFSELFEEKNADCARLFMGDTLLAFCAVQPPITFKGKSYRRVGHVTVQPGDKIVGVGHRIIRFIQSRAEVEGSYIYGFVHETMGSVRTFYRDLSVEEDPISSNFPPDFEKGIGAFASLEHLSKEGWICLWFPSKPQQPFTLSPSKLFLVLTGEGLSGVENDKKKLLARFTQANDVIRLEAEAIKITMPLIHALLEKHYREGVQKVIIYYTGHGANFIGEFPSFQGADGSWIHLEDLHKFCSHQKFSMSIIGSDCCNNVVRGLLSPLKRELLLPRSLEDFDPFNASGHLIFTSAKKTQRAWGNSEGGFFTTALVQNFQGNWLKALELSKVTTNDLLKDSKITFPQEPHFTHLNWSENTAQSRGEGVLSGAWLDQYFKAIHL